MNKSLYILGFICFLALCCQAQESTTQKDIIYYRDGSVFIGEIIVDYSPSMRMALVTGDTITLKRSLVKRRIDGSDVFVFPKGKFHYASGTYTTFSIGTSMSENITMIINLEVEKIITDKLDLGLSIGYNYNEIIFDRLGGTFGMWLDSHTMPIAVQGRYYLNTNKTRFYGIGKLGYGIASNGGFNNIIDSKGGINLYGGVGMTYASKWNGKFFVEVAQYSQKSSITILNQDFNLQPVELEFDGWFQRIILSYGLRYKI